MLGWCTTMAHLQVEAAQPGACRASFKPKSWWKLAKMRATPFDGLQAFAHSEDISC